MGEGGGLVRSPVYVGAERRSGKRTLFNRQKRRLDDVHVEPEAIANAESMERMLRRLRVIYDVATFNAEQRADLVATLEAVTMKSHESDSWAPWALATAGYIRAVGAKGALDEKLILEAVHAISNVYSTGGEDKPSLDLLVRLEQARLPR